MKLLKHHHLCRLILGLILWTIILLLPRDTHAFGAGASDTYPNSRLDRTVASVEYLAEEVATDMRERKNNVVESLRMATHALKGDVGKVHAYLRTPTPSTGESVRVMIAETKKLLALNQEKNTEKVSRVFKKEVGHKLAHVSAGFVNTLSTPQVLGASIERKGSPVKVSNQVSISEVKVAKVVLRKAVLYSLEGLSFD